LKKALPYILPLLAGVTLLFIPLLRDLHFESAMLAGIIGCFWAGIRASASHTKHDFFPTLRILGVIYISALPLFIFSLITNCLTIDGLGFWIFIPFPSAFFGAAIGRLARELKFPFPKLVTVLILLFCAIGIWGIEFFIFPQVYFYNHVWGVWPGPIYDEAVSLTGSFFYFRWLTFLWIVLLWMIPSWSQDLQSKLITGLALVCLMFSYLNLDEAGIISPTKTIQERLGGYHKTEHFELYYDSDSYSEEEIAYWSARHEFHFHQVTEILEIDWPEGRKIVSYLYAHAWQKKDITGAKFTSYVPIWLEQDQLHIAKQQMEGVLKHELVHVISKQFGNSLFNGSWSIGLIEGVAEGIAKDASPRSTLHQIVAAEKPWPSAEEMKSALSFWGFYGSAGSISYTTTGSFVEYLLGNYPVYSFKEAYSKNDFKHTYYQSIDSLVSGWHQTLEQTEVDSTDREVSEFIFAQRSLFEKDCPHAITKELRLWDQYQLKLASEDSTSAFEILDELYTLDPENNLVKNEWVRFQLHQNNYSTASNAFTTDNELLSLRVLQADALFLSQGFEKADYLLDEIRPEIEAATAPNFKYSLEMRADSIQWRSHVQRRFLHILPDSAAFTDLNLPNKMLSLDKAIQQKKARQVFLYALLLQDHTPNRDWLNVYESAINYLAFRGKTEIAQTWIDLALSANLRSRHQERLEESQKWLTFLITHQQTATFEFSN